MTTTSMMSEDEYEAHVSDLLDRFSELFQSSKTPFDTSRELLSLVKSYPTSACAEALADSAFTRAHDSPTEVDALAVAMKNLLDTLKASPIVIYGEYGESDSFDFVLGYTLSDFLSDRLHQTLWHKPKEPRIMPTNGTLSAALFAASGIKHRLFGNHSDVYALTRRGLQFPVPDGTRALGKRRAEVLALSACLQLSVAGATMMENWLARSDGQEAVVQALIRLKTNGVVSSTQGGMYLLDRTTEIAKAKFTKGISPRKAWGILFPDDAYKSSGRAGIFFPKRSKPMSNTRLPLAYRTTLRALSLRR